MSLLYYYLYEIWKLILINMSIVISYFRGIFISHAYLHRHVPILSRAINIKPILYLSKILPGVSRVFTGHNLI